MAGEENGKAVCLRSIYIGEDEDLYYGGYLYTTNVDKGLGVKAYGKSGYTSSFWHVTYKDGYFRLTRDYTQRDLVGMLTANGFQSYPTDDVTTNHDLIIYRWIPADAIYYTQFVSSWSTPPSPPTGWNMPIKASGVHKVMIEGQLYILRAGQTFTIDGRPINNK